jgi:hypothetical protein
MPFTPNKIGNQSWISIDARKAVAISALPKFSDRPPPLRPQHARQNFRTIQVCPKDLPVLP